MYHILTKLIKKLNPFANKFSASQLVKNRIKKNLKYQSSDIFIDDFSRRFYRTWHSNISLVPWNYFIYIRHLKKIKHRIVHKFYPSRSLIEMHYLTFTVLLLGVNDPIKGVLNHTL